jgi:heptosyltransferase-2
VDQVIELEKGFLGYWRTNDVLRAQNFDAALTLPTSLSSAFLFFAAGIPHRAGWNAEGRFFCLTQIVPHPNPRQKHLVWEFLELVRVGLSQPLAQKTFQLSAPVDSEAQKELKVLLNELGLKDAKGLIALGPGATYGPAKRWPLAYWKQLVDELMKDPNQTLLVLGGPEEKTYLQELFDAGKGERLISLVGRTTPSVLAALLENCQVLVTNDTGPMHVAAAVGTPTVALFGSTSPTWTRPFGLGHEVIYKNEECSPCFQKTCPIGYGCLHHITVSEVLASVKKVLQGSVKVRGEELHRELAS